MCSRGIDTNLRVCWGVYPNLQIYLRATGIYPPGPRDRPAPDISARGSRGSEIYPRRSGPGAASSGASGRSGESGGGSGEPGDLLGEHNHDGACFARIAGIHRHESASWRKYCAQNICHVLIKIERKYSFVAMKYDYVKQKPKRDRAMIYIRIVTGKHKGKTGTVTASNRGWYTVITAEEDEIKVRVSQVEELEQECLVDDDNDDVSQSESKEKETMPARLKRYRAGYVSHTIDGKKRLDNGDTIADILRSLPLADVLRVASVVLDDGAMLTKYDHLNPGQRRMCSGNRIRAAVKRGDVTEEVLRAAV